MLATLNEKHQRPRRCSHWYRTALDEKRMAAAFGSGAANLLGKVIARCLSVVSRLQRTATDRRKNLLKSGQRKPQGATAFKLA